MIAYKVFDPGSPPQSKAMVKHKAKEVFVADACRHNGARGPRARSGRRKRSVSGHVRSRESLKQRPSEVTIDIDVASTIYSVQIGAGLVMIDTGCRRACGGRLWHERLREELDARGGRYYREEALEYFQLGPGDPIASHARWAYSVGILGCSDTVRYLRAGLSVRCD